MLFGIAFLLFYSFFQPFTFKSNNFVALETRSNCVLLHIRESVCIAWIWYFKIAACPFCNFLEIIGPCENGCCFSGSDTTMKGGLQGGTWTMWSSMFPPWTWSGCSTQTGGWMKVKATNCVKLSYTLSSRSKVCCSVNHLMVLLNSFSRDYKSRFAMGFLDGMVARSIMGIL